VRSQNRRNSPFFFFLDFFSCFFLLSCVLSGFAPTCCRTVAGCLLVRARAMSAIRARNASVAVIDGCIVTNQRCARPAPKDVIQSACPPRTGLGTKSFPFNESPSMGCLRSERLPSYGAGDHLHRPFRCRRAAPVSDFPHPLRRSETAPRAIRTVVRIERLFVVCPCVDIILYTPSTCGLRL